MRIAYAITLTFVIWLIASLYCIHSHHVNSHTLYKCVYLARPVHRNTNNSGKTNNNIYIFFLATSPLQAPLVHKWNGDLSRAQRKTSIAIQNNTNVQLLCRMAYARSLDKNYDGVKDMETSQNKKRTSSNACLVVVEKNKNKSNTSKQNDCIWLGFKAMNVLNASNGLAEVPHKSVTELVKIGMNEKEALECQ